MAARSTSSRAMAAGRNRRSSAGSYKTNRTARRADTIHRPDLPNSRTSDYCTGDYPGRKTRPDSRSGTTWAGTDRRCSSTAAVARIHPVAAAMMPGNFGNSACKRRTDYRIEIPRSPSPNRSYRIAAVCPGNSDNSRPSTTDTTAVPAGTRYPVGRPLLPPSYPPGRCLSNGNCPSVGLRFWTATAAPVYCGSRLRPEF